MRFLLEGWVIDTLNKGQHAAFSGFWTFTRFFFLQCVFFCLFGFGFLTGEMDGFYFDGNISNDYRNIWSSVGVLGSKIKRSRGH